MSNNTTAKKPRGRDTLKKALERQKERLIPQMLALDTIVDQIEADWPCHRLHLVLGSIRRAVFDLLPVERRGVPDDYFTPEFWLRVFSPVWDENGYVTEADLLREALALARPNGPENEDGVCEVLGARGRCEIYFSVHLLRLAYKNCPITPFPDDKPKTDEAPKDPPRSKNQAPVLDLWRFREERRTR